MEVLAIIFFQNSTFFDHSYNVSSLFAALNGAEVSFVPLLGHVGTVSMLV
jgi:hypothetical protein